MKIQTTATGAECAAADRQQLVPPVGRRRRRALLGSWQVALQAFPIIISIVSLTMSSVVFMALLYTPASGPLGQSRDLNDLREVVDMQRQMIGRLQREDNYQDARQKALQSALAAAGLLTDDVRARLQGIELALMAKEQEEVPADIAELVAAGTKNDRSALIGRPDGHQRFFQNMKASSDSDEDSSEMIV